MCPVAAMNSELWQACAGPLVNLPPVNSVVYYFPQGHAETADSPPKFAGATPHAVRCRLTAVELLADPKTDDPYAKFTLAPIPNSVGHVIDDAGKESGKNGEPPCPKVLTQSDANNGGGFSVPKACAVRVFPELDYTADPPVQTIVPRDIHGVEWTFRHIYRGTPRRHLLTSGWSSFVNSKSLVAGDCLFFMRLSGGGMGVGIRRGRRFGGGRVTAEDVTEATRLAVQGKPFKVVYEPGADFVVRTEKFDRLIHMISAFTPGSKVAMDIEDALDPTLKKPLLGAICSFQPLDPIFFPISPWRMLKVVWGENDVSLVNPWSITFQSLIPLLQTQLPFNVLRNEELRPERVDQAELTMVGTSYTTTNDYLNGVKEDNVVDHVPSPDVPKELWLDGVTLGGSSLPNSDVPTWRSYFLTKEENRKTKVVRKIGLILEDITARKKKKIFDDLELSLEMPKEK